MAQSEIDSPTHPLSEHWNQTHPDSYHLTETTDLLGFVRSWIQAASTTCGDSITDKVVKNLDSVNLSEYSTFLDKNQSHYSFPASALLYDLPDKVLETLLSSFPNTSPIVYIKCISRELKQVFSFYKTLEQENQFLRNKITEKEHKFSKKTNQEPNSFGYSIYDEITTNSLSMEHFTSNKSMDRRLGILSDLIKESRTNDSPDRSSIIHKISDNDEIFSKPVDNNTVISSNPEFLYSLPNYDSDDSTDESFSSQLSPGFETENPLVSKTTKCSKSKELLPSNLPRPRPFHFRAITLASKLLANSNASEPATPNSKRASKRITNWTLGLLKGAKLDRPEATFPMTFCDIYAGLDSSFAPSEYEMEVQLTDKKLKKNHILSETPAANVLLTSPFPENFETAKEFFEPNFESKTETNCVEMTPLPHGRGRSRRSSVVLMSPTFSPASGQTTVSENEMFVLPPSNCTSPTIGISTLTTKGHPSTSTTLPTVSKLLSRIIETQKSVGVLSVEERWHNFMNTHAPTIQSTLNSTLDSSLIKHDLSTLSHPLVSSPPFEVSQENLETPLSSRQPIILNRLSPEERREFRRLARAGIPLQFRAKIWYECSGAAQMNEAGYFHGLVLETMSSSHLPCKEQIELDIYRTMPNNSYFSRNGPGIAKLRRVLLAYSIHNPTVGYCQSMNLITATLLLTLSSEEETFWTLACLIERILPSEYFTSDLLVSQADQRVLSDQVAEFLPNIAAHFNTLEVDLGAITFNWFLTLYADCVSFHVLIRIWDVLLAEGPATLFRFALSLLELHEKDILSKHTSSAVYSYLKNLPLDAGRHLDQVTKLAFCTYKSRVSYDQIKLSRKKHLDSLKAQFYF